MDKVEAIQSVKDMCERHKQNHKRYPTTVQVSGEVWQALVEPGYIFPPHAEPSVRVPLMDMGGSFSLELGPLAPIPVVKVTPRLPKMRHDGKLDEFHGWSRGFVEHMDNVDNDTSKHRAGIHIHDDYADFECNCIYLDAKQALSLLDWLEQEQSALERLAKEQE